MIRLMQAWRESRVDILVVLSGETHIHRLLAEHRLHRVIKVLKSLGAHATVEVSRIRATTIILFM